MTTLILAFFAGVLTTLNPCVLPVLPIIIASAFTHGRIGPLALGLGMVLSFTTIGTMLAASGQVFGLSEATLRFGAASMIIVFGTVLLASSLQGAFAGALQPIADRASSLAARAAGLGLPGQVLVGALLGVVWTPCSGPSLGAAITLAAQAGGFGPALVTMAIFSLGAAGMLTLFAMGSRAAVMARRDRLMGLANAAKPALGVLLVSVGLVVLTGLDKRLETLAVDLMPEWLVTLTTSL